MSLSPGTRLGPYEILSAVGAGGMGEVYRAKDTRLERIVAIKVLPQHLSQNSQLRQRFEREARAISSISHPHICALYDIGHQNGLEFLVMEYLEGDTLAHRLSKGPMPNDLLLRTGVQIAEALDRAHRQGVVHRDLKPGNIMLTKSGAKLLDFGLAKLGDLTQDPGSQSQIATKMGPLTEDGVMLGTVQYMAPEQLEGKPADARTDIFALGGVLYEMATGQRAFQGASKANVITAILSSDPAPISTIQPTAPPALDHAIRKCLAKDPEDRWQDARDVAGELKWISESSVQSSTPHAAAVASRKKIPERAIWIALILLLLGLSAFLYTRSSVRSRKLLKLSVPPVEKARLTGHIALSPDGKSVAFVAKNLDGESALWVRPFDSLIAKRLPGTQDASLPFWSPDSRLLGFFAQGKLKTIDVTEGPPQTLAEAPSGRGGTWNQNGVIIFAPNFTSSGLMKVSAEGGPVTPIISLDPSKQVRSLLYPYFLPDGNHFLYVTRSKNPELSGLNVGSLDHPDEGKLLIPMDHPTRAEYGSGYIFFIRESNLVCRRFDPKSFKFRGEVIPVTERLGFDGSYYSFSMSDNGVLSYTNVDLVNSQIVWFDRSGKQVDTVGPPAGYIEPNLSPDEKKLIIGRVDGTSGFADLWMVEFARQTFTRFTFDPVNKYSGLWSPDGSRIVFAVNRVSTFDLYEKPSSGAGSEDVLLSTPQPKFSDDWSKDGKYILYETEFPKTKYDLWVLPTVADRKPQPYLQTEFNEAHGQFSPDGNWVAYGSDEIGRTEIYVRRFPNASAGKWQISTGGGDQPVWRRDGKELFYLSPDGKLMAVEVTTGQSFDAGVPTPLFQTGVNPQPLVGSDRNQYQVSTDGQRFLVNTVPADMTYAPITVIFNWLDSVKHD